MIPISTQQIRTRLQWVLDAPKESGIVEALVVRPKTNLREILTHAIFSPDKGVIGDNWISSCWKKIPDEKSDPEVQVAIMSARMIEVITEDKTQWSLAGDQLFVDFDLSLANLSTGDRLQVGTAVLEITAEPHRGCNKFKQRFGADAYSFVNSKIGDSHRLRGVYAKIISAGEVSTGSIIRKLSQK